MASAEVVVEGQELVSTLRREEGAFSAKSSEIGEKTSSSASFGSRESSLIERVSLFEKDEKLIEEGGIIAEASIVEIHFKYYFECVVRFWKI